MFLCALLLSSCGKNEPPDTTAPPPVSSFFLEPDGKTLVEESSEPVSSLEESSIEEVSSAPPSKAPVSSAASSKEPPKKTPEPPPKPAEIRAVWISYLEFESFNCKTEASFKSNIIRMYDLAKAYGMNTVFMQVRAFGDSLYPSEFYPWSHLLSGTQGVAPAYSAGFDPMKFMIEEAHRQGLSFHAWLNPLRVKLNDKKPAALSADNPATKNPGWVIPCTGEGLTILNVTESGVRKLIIDGIKEIVTKYDVDGIHFDDYFYGGYTSINITEYTNGVNILLKDIHTAIKAIKKDVLFGVSPNGNIAGIKKQGCDAAAWGKGGYMDYICPQIYWTDSYGSASSRYSAVLDQWEKLITSNEVALYAGLALYKVNTVGTLSLEKQGIDLGWDDPSRSIMKKQVEAARKKSKYGGFILFRINFFAVDDNCKEEMKNLKSILK